MILLFAGVDGVGKGGTANLLNEWTDPRWIITRAYAEPSQKKRLESLEKDPLQSWRVTKRDWRHWKRYDDFVPA